MAGALKLVLLDRGSLVADEVDGAPHVDIHKVHFQVFIQQLGTAPQGIRKPSADLRQQQFSYLSVCMTLYNTKRT